MRKMTVAVAALVVLAGCSSGSDAEFRPGITAPSTDLTLAETTTTADEKFTSTCQSASADDVAEIEAALAGNADHLGPAFTAHYGEYRFVVADILGVDGERVSSLDAWILVNGTPTALTGSANEYSDLPDWDDVAEPLEMQSYIGENEFTVAYAIGECITRG